jgi:hypothetical protein
MSDTSERCKNCKFFDKHGKCRRYPPQVFIVRDLENIEVMRHLPPVNKDEYCGEFEPAKSMALFSSHNAL